MALLAKSFANPLDTYIIGPSHAFAAKAGRVWVNNRKLNKVNTGSPRSSWGAKCGRVTQGVCVVIRFTAQFWQVNVEASDLVDIEANSTKRSNGQRQPGDTKPDHLHWWPSDPEEPHWHHSHAGVSITDTIGYIAAVRATRVFYRQCWHSTGNPRWHELRHFSKWGIGQAGQKCKRNMLLQRQMQVSA